MSFSQARDPFADLNRKASWQARLGRWRRTLLRPFLPDRIVPGREGPPNLLLLGIDTLRADHLGLDGYHRPTSANLDRLAGKGTVFTDVTAPAPWTLPSFSSALCGMMPGLHGAFLPGPMRNMDTQPPGRLDPGVVTLARHLQDHGYRTAAFYSNQFFAFGLAESFQQHRYANLPAGDLLELAGQWIRRHADRPFFCFVLLNDPHEPTTPPVADLAPFLAELADAGIAADPADLPAFARWGDPETLHLGHTADADDRDTARARALKLAIYDATISYVDRSLGEFQARLESWDLASSTLVSVFADHGEEFLDHGEFSRLWNHDPRGIHGIGHGHTLFQELLHVPWISWGPGVPAGVRREQPVSLCDLAPTICDWLQVPGLVPDPAAPGFAGHLWGRSQARPRDDGRQGDRLILSEAIAFGPDLVALRRGRWKLVAHRSGQVLALFDLKTDPGEKTDQAGAHPEVVAGLLAELEQWRESARGQDDGHGDRPRNWDELEDTVRQRLKDLGYSD